MVLGKGSLEGMGAGITGNVFHAKMGAVCSVFLCG